MGHGAGGRMMTDLIEHLFAPAFDNEWLGQMGDAATISLQNLLEGNQAGNSIINQQSAINNSLHHRFLRDQPTVFPGREYRRVAVYGTVNDLAMRGPDRFPLGRFHPGRGPANGNARRHRHRHGAGLQKGRRKNCHRRHQGGAKGHGDGIYINTSGIGVIPAGVDIGPRNARPATPFWSADDGRPRHRHYVGAEGLTFQTEIQSDTAPLYGLVEAMIQTSEVSQPIHCLRDATRGGLAAVLNELAGSSKVGIEFDERKVPLRPEVKAACEMLGLDPFYVANEGKLVTIVPGELAEQVLAAMHAHEYGKEAALIGRVVAEHAGLVTAKTSIGGMRVVTSRPASCCRGFAKLRKTAIIR